MKSHLNPNESSLVVALSISLLLHAVLVVLFFQFEKKFFKLSLLPPEPSQISISISSDSLADNPFSESSKPSIKHSDLDIQSSIKQSANVAPDDASYPSRNSSDTKTEMKSKSTKAIPKPNHKNLTKDKNNIVENSSAELKTPLRALSGNISDAVWPSKPKSKFPSPNGAKTSQQKLRDKVKDQPQRSTHSQASSNAQHQLRQPNTVNGPTSSFTNRKSIAKTKKTASIPADQKLDTSKDTNEIVINQIPKCKRCIEPKYPRSALRSGNEGIVEVRVSISKSGRVVNANLIRSSGDRSLDKAALNAALSSTFYPLKKNSSRIIHYEMNIKTR